MKKYNYVYIIINKVEKKYYIGVRSCDIKPKDDLGKKYFSSSTDKDFIKEQKENPKKFKYKIISEFETRKKAIEKEIELHEKYNVNLDTRFYNKAKQTSKGFDSSGKPLSEEHKAILSKCKKGIPLSEEHKRKLSESRKGEKNHNFGKPKSDEIKAKIGKSNKGKIISKETREKISIANKGKKMSEEIRTKISCATKGVKKTAEHSNNISKSKKGFKHSEESKAKMSKSKKGCLVWNSGKVGVQSHSDDTKKKLSEHFTNTKWVNNGIVNKRILETDIYDMIRCGWGLGKCKKIK